MITTSVFATLMLVHMSSAWIRFREPISRRNFLNQALIEKLQNCAGKKANDCGICGEGPGETQTNLIPVENYTVVDPDVRLLAVELGFRAGLNGYLEFRICKVTDNSTADGIACNQTTPLLIGSNEKWYPGQNQSSAKSRFRLPRGLKCERCVLQVKYTPGPNTTMKDFRFFDCTFLNITHPTKAIKKTILTSRENPRRNVFPPDHSIPDETRGTTELRSANTFRGSVADGQVNDRNKVAAVTKTIKQDGSNVTVKKLPSGERTVSLFEGNGQSGGGAIIKSVTTNNISSDAINDRKVVISTSIFNITEDKNTDQSKADNQARITMIDIQQNNMTGTSSINSAENELNEVENAQNVHNITVTKEKSANKDIGIETNVEISRNKSNISRSANTSINNTSINFLNTNESIQKNNNLNGSSKTEINKKLVRDTQIVKHGINTEKNVEKKSQNVTVDWKIFNTDTRNYYDDSYYYYNETRTYNNTYYYDDYSNYNETSINNLADPITVITNITGEGLRGDAGNFVRGTDNVANHSSQSSNVNREAFNRNINSSTSLGSSRKVFGVSSGKNVNMDMDKNTGDIGVRVVTENGASSGVNSDVSGRNVYTSADKSLSQNVDVMNNKYVINSGTGSLVGTEGQNRYMVKDLNISSSVMNDIYETNIHGGSIQTTAVTSELSKTGFSNSTLAESSNTNRTGIAKIYSLKEHDIFNKSSIINKTVQMMADLNDRPRTRSKSNDASGAATVLNEAVDIGTDSINQQIVSVPHTIIVLPKYNIVTRPGQSQVQSDTGNVSMQNLSLAQKNQTYNQDNSRTITANHTSKEPTSLMDLPHQELESVPQDIVLKKAEKGYTEANLTNYIQDVPVEWIGKVTQHSNFVDTTESTPHNSLNTSYERESANATTINKNAVINFEHVTSTHLDEASNRTSEGPQLRKRLSYAISAADRRPNYANLNTVEMNPKNPDVHISVDSVRLKGVFSDPIGSVKNIMKEKGSEKKFSAEHGNTKLFRGSITESPMIPGTSIWTKGNNNIFGNSGRVYIENAKIDNSNGSTFPQRLENVKRNSSDTFESSGRFSTNNITGSYGGLGSFGHASENDTTMHSSENSGFPGHVFTTNADMFNSGPLTLGTVFTQNDINTFKQKSLLSSSTKQHGIGKKSDITGNNLNEFEILSSNIDISNQLFDGASSYEQTTTYSPASLKPIFDSTTATYATVNGMISTQEFDKYIGQPSSIPESAVAKDSKVMMDISTRTYDEYIGLPSTTVEPLNMGGSTFVRLVNYSLVTADSIFPAPKQDIRFSSDSSQFKSQSSTESILMSLFTSTPAPTEGMHLATLDKSTHDNTAVENSNFFANLNFLADSDANIDHLGGVPILTGTKTVDKGQWDSSKNKHRNTAGHAFISIANFDISNKLGDSKDHLKHRKSNEVVWTAPVKGLAIPVGSFTLDPNIKNEKSVNHSTLSAIPRNNQSDIMEKNMSISRDQLSTPTTSLNYSNGHNKRDNFTIGKTIVWQSMRLSNLSKADKKENNSNAPLLSEKDVKASRNLDISINGNAIINKITSTVNEETPRVITRVVNAPDIMPPIKVHTEMPKVIYRYRNMTDENLNKKSIASVLEKSKRNITLFTPYLTNAQNSNTQRNQRLRRVFTNGRSMINKEQNTNVAFSDTIHKTVNTASEDKTVSNNLSMTSMWDINRGNTAEKDQNETAPFPVVPVSDMAGSYAVYRLDNSNQESKRIVESPVNNMKGLSDSVAVKDKSEKDVNIQVLRTLEALVLELEAMEMKADKTRKPVVDSTVYRRPLGRNMNQDRILDSYPLFSVHQNLLPLPNNPVQGQFYPREVGRQRGSESHKLLNILGISNQRDWNSEIKLKASIGAEKINDTISRNKSTQQIVNLPNVKSSISDQFTTMLNTFANLSTGRTHGKLETTEVNPSVYAEKILQNTEIAKDVSTMTESRDQLTDSVSPFDSGIEGSMVKEQKIIRAANSTFLNPFTGQNITFSLPGKRFSDKFIVRGIGNLQHLKGVQDLYSANFTPEFPVSNYNFTPAGSLSGVISIEGKYLPGQMRRNEMGQFEPVPLASNFDSTLAEERPPATVRMPTKEGTISNSANMITRSRSVNAGMQEHPFQDKFRDNTKLIEKKQHGTVLSDIDTGDGIKFSESFKTPSVSSKIQTDNIINTDFSERIGAQDMNARSREYSVTGKRFFNQDDLFKTNGISFELPSKSSTDTSRGVGKTKSEFRENSLSCEQDEMFVCSAVGNNRHIPGMVWWCFSHCKNGVCPSEKCTCRCEKAQDVQKVNNSNSTNVSGSKPRKKIIHLTLNTPVEVSAPVSEPTSRLSKSKSMLMEIVRPKVLNATVNNVEQVNSSIEDSVKVKPIKLFQTPNVKCKGINAFANTTGIDELCTRICLQNLCPETICMCL